MVHLPSKSAGWFASVPEPGNEAGSLDGMDISDRLKALLDPDRLAVAGALVGTALTTDGLTAKTELDDRRVLAALGELKTVGLVLSEGLQHRLDIDALRAAASELEEPALPMDPAIGFGMTDDEREVLSRYFEGRTLVSLPTSRAKRLIVLERLALEFDVGQKYPEREVNSILGAFNPDWSMLRRHMVNEGMLDREQNVYWRSGGRVPGVYRG